MKYFYVLVLLFYMISCTEKEKQFKYYYIVTYEELSLFGDKTYTETSEPDTIVEISDSSAYMEAFKKFTISKKVSKDMNEVYGKVSKKPLSFQLFDEVGNDIAYTTFFDEKEILENELETFIFSRNNSIKDTYDNAKKAE